MFIEDITPHHVRMTSILSPNERLKMSVYQLGTPKAIGVKDIGVVFFIISSKHSSFSCHDAMLNVIDASQMRTFDLLSMQLGI